MLNSGKKTLVESTLMLVLMGVLAGALGGLAVGVATMHSASSASTTTH